MLVSGKEETDLWDLQKGIRVSRINGGNSVFFNNSKLFTTFLSDEGVRIWNLKGQELANLKGTISERTPFHISPDKIELATVLDGNIITIWNAHEKVQYSLKLPFNSESGQGSSAKISFVDNRYYLVLKDQGYILSKAENRELLLLNDLNVQVEKISASGREIISVRGNRIDFRDLNGRLFGGYFEQFSKNPRLSDFSVEI